jgi:hypothetical protein
MTCMWRVALRIVLVWTGFSSCWAQAGLAAPNVIAGRVVGARVPLTQAANGVEGELQLLKDERITAALAKQTWNTGGLDVDPDDYLASFKTSPPRQAMIRVVDRDGKVLDSEELERPLARIGTAQLYRDARVTFLLTVDYSAGFGSYSGPITSFLDVTGGRLHWVEDIDVSGKRSKISVMDSLKTGWRIVNAPNGGKEILEAACRPTEQTFKTGGNFTITYSRYFFDGTQWRLASRTVPGFTEFDGGFPSRRHFP